MARTKTSHQEVVHAVAPGQPVDRRLLQAASFLNRPIVIGLLALLTGLGACQSYGNTVSPSYQTPDYQARSAETAAPESSNKDGAGTSESDAVPLLFLSFVGLAGMALSRTGSSKERRGGPVSPGQKLSR